MGANPDDTSETGGAQLARLALGESMRRQRQSGELPLLCIPDPRAEAAASPFDSEENAMEQPRARFRFDPTINLGHILTFVGFIGTVFAAYNLLDKRLTVVEVQNTAQKEELRQATQILREDVKEVRKSVDDLTRSIRGIEPRPDRR